MSSPSEVDAAVATCRACPRLVAWREEAARVKRRAFRDWEYWARPVPGFGPPDAPLAIVGLAPAAHRGNRTGRIFTGDRSGDWLFAALHRAGLATLPTSERAGDGQRLLRTRMVAAVRCAPPANAPTPEERDTCAPWLDRELAFVAGSLMVSRFRYVSGKDIDPKMRIPVAFIVLVPLGFVLVGSSPPEMLFAAFALYASSGPLLWLGRRMRRGRRGTRPVGHDTGP